MGGPPPSPLTPLPGPGSPGQGENSQALLEVAGPGSGSPWTSVQVRHLGGALRRAGADAGAAGAIEEEFAFCAIGVTVPPMLEALAAHKPALAAAMAPHSSGRRLFNFLSAGDPATPAFDAATVARLRAVKRSRDPHGVFRSNRPICPSSHPRHRP
jgi:hypothetical protein